MLSFFFCGNLVFKILCVVLGFLGSRCLESVGGNVCEREKGRSKIE